MVFSTGGAQVDEEVFDVLVSSLEDVKAPVDVNLVWHEEERFEVLGDDVVVECLLQTWGLLEGMSILDVLLDARVVDVANPVFEHVCLLSELAIHFTLELLDHVLENNFFVTCLVEFHNDSFFIIKIFDGVINYYRVKAWFQISCKNVDVGLVWQQLVEHVHLDYLLVHLFEILDDMVPVRHFLTQHFLIEQALVLKAFVYHDFMKLIQLLCKLLLIRIDIIHLSSNLFELRFHEII